MSFFNNPNTSIISPVSVSSISIGQGSQTITAKSLSVNVNKKTVHLYAVVALYIGPNHIDDRVVYLNERLSTMNFNPTSFDTQAAVIAQSASILDALEKYNEKNNIIATLSDLKIAVVLKERHEVVE